MAQTQNYVSLLICIHFDMPFFEIIFWTFSLSSNRWNIYFRHLPYGYGTACIVCICIPIYTWKMWFKVVKGVCYVCLCGAMCLNMDETHSKMLQIELTSNNIIHIHHSSRLLESYDDEIDSMTNQDHIYVSILCPTFFFIEIIASCLYFICEIVSALHQPIETYSRKMCAQLSFT